MIKLLKLVTTTILMYMVVQYQAIGIEYQINVQNVIPIFWNKMYEQMSCKLHKAIFSYLAYFNIDLQWSPKNWSKFSRSPLVQFPKSNPAISRYWANRLHCIYMFDLWPFPTLSDLVLRRTYHQHFSPQILLYQLMSSTSNFRQSQDNFPTNF